MSDRFEDEASKRMCIKAELLTLSPKYLQKYYNATNWKDRHKICVDAIKYIEICEEEKFNELPTYCLNLEKFSFEGKKCQKDTDNIFDIFFMASALKTLFENQREFSLSKINKKGSHSYFMDMKSDLSFIIKALKLPRTWQDRVHLPLLPLEILNERLFELPNQDNTKEVKK